MSGITTGCPAANAIRDEATIFSPQVRQVDMVRISGVTGSPSQQLSNAKVRVVTTAPTSMDVNTSLPITVSIEPAEGSSTSIKDALAEYGITSLSVSLAGPGFNLAPAATQESQWLNEEKLQWTWVLAASSPGVQTLNVSVDAKGTPDWSTDPLAGQIWSGLTQVTVEQGSTGFDISKLDLFAPLNTLAGLGLSFPWLLEQIKKRRSKAQPAAAPSAE
jgi:hypothetical protein